MPKSVNDYVEFLKKLLDQKQTRVYDIKKSINPKQSSQILQQILILAPKISSKKMNIFMLNSTNSIPIVKWCPYLLIAPSTQQIQNLKSIPKASSCFKNATYMTPENICSSDSSYKYEESSDAESSQDKIEDYINSVSVHELRQRKRKNKEEKNQQIQANHKDDGRGGNCIASNISKTLNRIIGTSLRKQVFYKFSEFTKIYKVKSQKQNTIILLLILYVLARQGRISIQTIDDVFSHFMKSLKDSQSNCDKKMRAEQDRRNFHLKNKKMYSRFIDINEKLFSNLRNSLIIQNSSSAISLSQLQNIISDTYDRKQREIQKAMNKIKSIILNHSELRELFGYHKNDIQGILFEAIDYAYRRNLPKRCKQVKAKAEQIFGMFERTYAYKSDQDKYEICFMTLKLVEQKQKEIWEQFIENMCMKNEFNMTQSQIKELRNLVGKEVPERFKRQMQMKKLKIPLQSENSCKIQDETSQESSLYSIFQNIKNSIQY